MNDLYINRCKSLLDDGKTYEDLNNFDNFSDIFTKNEFKNIIKLKQNRKNKRNRTKKHLLEIVRFYDQIKNNNKKLVFGTCTLNNKVINYKNKTINQKINKWIKNHFVWSIVNVDFGSKTERLHYHFIGITIEDIESKNKKSKKGASIYELCNKDYDLGFEPDLCVINFSENDINKCTNYLLKLNNHSNKETTKYRVKVIKQDIVDVLYEKRKN